MKTELIEKFTHLLQTDDIASIKEEVRELLTAYNQLTDEEKRVQGEAWNEQEHEEGEEFEFQVNPLDEGFEAMVTDYKQKVKAANDAVKEERKTNLEGKRALLKRLELIIQHEENIGKAFSEFNEIGDEWKAIGHVPRDNHKAIMDDYTRLNTFFYNINIYKALQENDLKKNDDTKRELIEKVKLAKTMESVKDADNLIRECQKKWMDVGPSPRDNYKELADEFFGICREVGARIREHYDAIREKQDGNLVEKEALVAQMKSINDLEIVNHSTWNKKTKEVLEMQTAWKAIGFARKEDNERVWQDFRSACDTFFKRKGAYYEARRSVQDAHRDEKQALVEKAEALMTSTDWREATDALIALQKQWKNVGPAPQRDEQRLWQKFRGACDAFFSAKKKNFENQDVIQQENYRLKTALIEEVKAFELSGNKNTDLDALRQFSSRWNEIGYVPKNKINEVITNYNEAIDGHYDNLKMAREEKKMVSYKKRLDDIKSSGNSDHQIRREQSLLRDKIQRLKDRVRQYETNVELFKGDGAAALRKEVMKKIDAANNEIEEIKNKLSLIRD